MLARSLCFMVCTWLCGCFHGNSSECKPPGTEQTCTCDRIGVGKRVCRPDGTFAPCRCDLKGTAGTRAPELAAGTRAGPANAGAGGSTTAGRSGGGGTVAGTAGASGQAGTPGGMGAGSAAEPLNSAEALLQGSSELIDAFIHPSGIVVVQADAVVLIDREGAELDRWDAPRVITAAASDGKLLGIADGAIVTGFEVGDGLDEISSTTLLEGCQSAVLVSGGRFVCGPANDWDRIFYTYDLNTGELLASSDAYTYNGIPMRRIPQTDDFVSVTVGSSPSDFHLYRVGADHVVTFIGESPYHGDFAATHVYGFDAEPPSNLITHEGLLLDLTSDDCAMSMGTRASGCFLKNGAIGTLTGSQQFAAMDNDGGTLYGLVTPGGTYFRDPVCERGCLLQSIDVAGRERLTQTAYPLDIGRVVALAFDPDSSKVMVASQLVGEVIFDDDPYPGFRIDLLDL